MANWLGIGDEKYLHVYPKKKLEKMREKKQDRERICVNIV